MGNMIDDYKLKQQVLDHAKNLAEQTGEAKPFMRYGARAEPQPMALADFTKCVINAEYRPSLKGTRKQLDYWNSWPTGVYCYINGVSYELEHPRLKPRQT